ncbi:hypothetical protein E4P54_16840 [Salmonella enterica subsp. enterica serovar Panama]|uniref:hypothetical protein n=1 Tax=Enterobacteriaceae TaxID=543 RepID=UPI001474AFF2|nr:hypothetical protein [Salmonella enterica]EGC7113197.1 hypothetical protein [Salmonella enterica]EGO0258974.1 hypothetical protein [Salmonella enterica subsp. enterica serovar Panama]EGP7450203.1 hypothetical protein [Salmonella enterica subsp. enterica serovar Panama]NMF70768.1 hypothetical protein [Salmonella enterica subsp. enterica serovar Panama]NMF75492.1 hypothetical protein [Salmonella enterica subsp. enterica serovar Panama]
MQVRVTINPILFPELIHYLESKPSGQRSSSLLALANRALLAGDSFLPGVVRETSKKRKSEQKKSVPGPNIEKGTGQMTSQLCGDIPKENEDKEPKFRQLNSSDIVNSVPSFHTGSDVQQHEVKYDQLSTANLTSKPEIAGKIPGPNPGDKSGVGEAGSNQDSGVNEKVTPRRVRIS